MIGRRYNRKTTNIPISIFYEQYQLNKYNFDPPYQRDKNVWDIEQKSFLIDTIMKNFPMPPIFLEQKIDNATGKTNFDVIDGKQRLLTIVEFINNKVALPETFGKDDYGNEQMNGKTFEELKVLAKESQEIYDFISDFWSYVINIEYIENPDYKVVDNIFDRLNRGGERLNPQELRKANYYDTIMYQDIESLRNDEFIFELLSNLNKNRLEDVSFLTEIYLLVATGTILEGNDLQIDKYFKETVDNVDEETSKQIVNIIEEIRNVVKLFNLDYGAFKIKGVSHLYAICYLAYVIYSNKITVDESLVGKVQRFYEDLRSNRENEYVVEYHKSMQSASKSKSSRRKRVVALLKYLDIAIDV